MSQSSVNIQAVDEQPSYAAQAASQRQLTAVRQTTAIADDSTYEDIDGVQQATQATDDSLYEDIDGVQDLQQQQDRQENTVQGVQQQGNTGQGVVEIIKLPQRVRTRSVCSWCNWCCFLPSILATRRVTSGSYIASFTVNGMRSKVDVSVLSVSPNGQLLIVGATKDKQVHILNTTTGRRLTSISIPNGTLYDAVWAPRTGYIVCTLLQAGLILVLNRSGDVIARPELPSHSTYINVGANGTLYVSQGQNGISYSDDDGVTWSSLFKQTDNLPDGLGACWRCWQALQVTAGSRNNTVWSVERYCHYETWRVRVYTVDKLGGSQAKDRLTWRDLTPPGLYLTQKSFIKSIYALDAYGNVFMTDDDVFISNAIHVWSAKCEQYDSQLNLSKPLTDPPRRLAVSNQNGHVMYVGTQGGNIDVYTLIYD